MDVFVDSAGCPFDGSKNCCQMNPEHQAHPLVFIADLCTSTAMTGQGWECLESRKIFRSGTGNTTYIELYEDRVKTSKGEIVNYTKYHASDVVIVVPYLDNDMLVMIRQFRYPLGKVLLEFPAGHVEGSEDPAETARRELEEETGYNAKNIEYVYSYHPSVSRSNQTVHVFKARGLAKGMTRHDGGEDISVQIIASQELREQIAQRKVESAGTLVSYLLCCTDTVASDGGH